MIMGNPYKADRTRMTSPSKFITPDGEESLTPEAALHFLFENPSSFVVAVEPFWVKRFVPNPDFPEPDKATMGKQVSEKKGAGCKIGLRLGGLAIIDGSGIEVQSGGFWIDFENKKGRIRFSL